ncbi:MAG: helix-turn-helix domain-containing protein [Rhodovulum sp.]
MLTVEEVAEHWAFRPDTVRRHIRAKNVDAMRVHRSYRIDWPNVWACEGGRFPRGRQAQRYQAPLLTKKDLADHLRVSPRTVERWMKDGLPTRPVFGAVRFNPHDACDWLNMRFDLSLDPSDFIAS